MRNNGFEETHKVLYHYSANTVYKDKDVLFLINFYYRNAAELKFYMNSLYKKNLPNIVFIHSVNEYNYFKRTHLMLCPESTNKSLFYICIEKVVKRYPNI